MKHAPRTALQRASRTLEHSYTLGFLCAFGASAREPLEEIFGPTVAALFRWLLIGCSLAAAWVGARSLRKLSDMIEAQEQIRSLRGFLPGLDTRVERDPDRV